MRKDKAVLLVILAVLASTSVVYAVSTYQKTIYSTGTVKVVGVGAYWDANCTDTVISIDWGTIEPGTFKTAAIYLKNEGNSPITLSLNSSNWSPSVAEGYMSLIWNYTGENLQPYQALPITLTLTVAQNITGITTFSFDIIIKGTG